MFLEIPGVRVKGGVKVGVYIVIDDINNFPALERQATFLRPLPSSAPMRSSPS